MMFGDEMSSSGVVLNRLQARVLDIELLYNLMNQNRVLDISMGPVSVVYILQKYCFYSLCTRSSLIPFSLHRIN